MHFPLHVLADWINASVSGTIEKSISTFAPLDKGSEGSIGFLANMKYENQLYNTKCGAVIVSSKFVPQKPVSTTLLFVEDPYASFALLLRKYQEFIKGSFTPYRSANCSVHESAEVHEETVLSAFVVISGGAKIAKEVSLGAGVFIGKNVQIGEGTQIFAGAKILDNCIVGKNCVLQSGAIIGSDGFGFAPNKEGVFEEIPQLGNVVLEDNVHIGANTTIDRATLGTTLISKGVKLDNLVQIGHNVEIGENTVIAAQVGIAGSAKIGKNCMIAGQAGIVGHIQIADNTKIAAKTGINSSIRESGKTVSGIPHMAYMDDMKSKAYFKKLPQIVKRIEDLERKQ